MVEIFSLPASTSLLTEVNAVGSPGRTKAQDGTIGDRAHAESVSDHNLDESGNTGSVSDSDNIDEVHARDVDSRGPWLIDGGAERIVQIIVARVRDGLEKRVRYLIYRKRIWHWVNGQFVQSTYTGSDPHELHFHVSFNYGSGAGASNPENITTAWGILAAYEAEQNMSAGIDTTDVANIVKGFRNTGGTGILSDTERSFIAAAVDVRLAAKLDALTAAVAGMGDGGDVDETAIATAVLAGLTPERLGAAITAAGLTPQALADALPDEQAQEIADILAARLAS